MTVHLITSPVTKKSLFWYSENTVKNCVRMEYRFSATSCSLADNPFLFSVKLYPVPTYIKQHTYIIIIYSHGQCYCKDSCTVNRNRKRCPKQHRIDGIRGLKSHLWFWTLQCCKVKIHCTHIQTTQLSKRSLCYLWYFSLQHSSYRVVNVKHVVLGIPRPRSQA